MSIGNPNIKYELAVITMSDKGSKKDRIDACELVIYDIMIEYGWSVVYTAIIPDEHEDINRELTHCADKMQVPLILTTGGTGISNRDVTPEVTKELLHRELLGLPEIMRAELAKTSKVMATLSRGVAGIRNDTLIINLPDEEKEVGIALKSIGESLGTLFEDLMASKK